MVSPQTNLKASIHHGKAFRAESTSFGFLDISPFSIKEARYSPHHNLHFVLMKGHLEVVIQNTTFPFKAKGTAGLFRWVPLFVQKLFEIESIAPFTA
ncbi:hypothetical protein TNIN_304111 [Trichonephila inaurata madagascariensis]|uniref:Uncharacterized protein n=1 Tax=Trichonephila inaurata madagascariensis TaxID=2747483 RepID=A0A8X6MLR8_9ARAC|nr:hypothetical protein TNIN_304111 [Trichonephila inaurata madagascariensis]